MDFYQDKLNQGAAGAEPKNHPAVREGFLCLPLDAFDAVIFDLDGTLVDSMGMWGQIDVEFLARFGLETPPDLQKLILGLSWDETEQYFVDHTTGIYPAAATGVPYSAGSMQVKGDIIADIHEDLAAEQKARVTYDNILRFCDDPDVLDPIRFLREREIVHFQRFGEALRIITDKLDSKNFYAFNPEFDRRKRKK